jgi:aldose 1-epimerase
MPVHETVEIGGARAVTLQRPASQDPEKPAFLSAQILPGRGMMTLQVSARVPSHGDVDLLFAAPLDEARELLDRGEDGFPANGSYLIGGAILLPYANRIRGELSPDGKTVLTEILGRPVRLPANARGRKP